MYILELFCSNVHKEDFDSLSLFIAVLSTIMFMTFVAQKGIFYELYLFYVYVNQGLHACIDISINPAACCGHKLYNTTPTNVIHTAPDICNNVDILQGIQSMQTLHIL